MNDPFKGDRAVDASGRNFQCVFRCLLIPCPFRNIQPSGLASGYDFNILF